MTTNDENYQAVDVDIRVSKDVVADRRQLREACVEALLAVLPDETVVSGGVVDGTFALDAEGALTFNGERIKPGEFL